MSKSRLEYFHPLIQEWFQKKFGKPTDIQEKSWESISKSNHVLITAPTGSGKTLSAFLWAINQLISGVWNNDELSVLYISPLKALNNDIQKNLLEPLLELKELFKKNNVKFPDINVLTRSGDTPNEERRKIYRNPPEILITTPESLNIILSSKNSRLIFSNLKSVILDEIHNVAGSKRGTYLITAIERLTLLAGELQRISLSATVKPLDKVSDFVGGYKLNKKSAGHIYEKRNLQIIKSDRVKDYDIEVTFPDELVNDSADDSRWVILVNEFKQIINKNKSTLFFTNSRRLTEKITMLINEGEDEILAYSHHGSLSKEIRLAVEEKLKEGKLKAIVATSSLELGIDIGELDQVVLIQTPGSISSAIQRIGRSGHNVNKTSKGLLFPTHGKDFLDAAVIAKCVKDKDIEEIIITNNPLDVLAQVILSMTLVDEWDIDELFTFIKTSYPFHNLSRLQYDLVLEMLAGRYSDTRQRELTPRVIIDKLENKIKAKDGVSYLLFMSGGTIPDRGSYNLRLADTKAKIGELDEEFVWERTIGESFILGNQLWRIQRITHNDVEVVKSNDILNIIPFWRAEEFNRDYYYSEKIMDFLEYAEMNLKDSDFFKNVLIDKYFMSNAGSNELINYLLRQKKETGTELPHRHHVLIEHFNDPFNKVDSKQVILHTMWGGAVNRPFAFALSSAWEDKYGYTLQSIVNNDCIMLILPHDLNSKEIINMITPENLEKHLRKKLEPSGYFGAKFRENAQRALLLPRQNFNKRMPLWFNRLRSKKLLDAVSKFTDFPILLETWRSCLQDDFDLKSLKNILDELHSGKIKVSETITSKASPFADDLIWRQTNKYMYEDDTPLSDKQSNLSDEIIKEVLYSSAIRPKISKELINRLDRKLKRTEDGYSPVIEDDVLEWVKERLLMPLSEWEELIKAIERDSLKSIDEILDKIYEKIIILTIPDAKEPFLMAIENSHKVLKCFDLNNNEYDYDYLTKDNDVKAAIDRILKIFLNKYKKTSSSEEDNNYSFTDFLEQWLSYYGPIEEQELLDKFGVDKSILESTIETLLERGTILIDKFKDNSVNTEVCDIKNLEILLRWTRKSRQPEFKTLSIDYLSLFLSQIHELNFKGDTSEDLQNTLERLFGYPLPVNMFEESIFPSRLEPYYTSWLDTLMQSSELAWFGCNDKKIAFTFISDLKLFYDGEYKDKSKLDIIPSKERSFTFFDLMNHTGLNSKDASEKIWKLVWRGIVSNDTYISLRQGILNGFKPEKKEDKLKGRSGFNRWKKTRPLTGNWYYNNINKEDLDILEIEEIQKDRVRQLFIRYGVLFREILSYELPQLQWKNVFKTLRIMELSGEILSGYFFEGISGLQFISHEALRILENGLNEDAIYWINALDPVSLCGKNIDKLKGILPKRLATTYMVFHGRKLVLVLKRNAKEIEINIKPDNKNLIDYFKIFNILITRQFNPFSKISIEKINDNSVDKSEYLNVMKEYGFKKSYKGLELWKRY